MQFLTVGRRNVNAVAFAPDGRALVAASPYDVPLLWELPATGAPIRLAEQITYLCSAFTFSANAAVVGWIAENKRREYDRRTGTARQVALAPDVELLSAQAVCGPDGRLVVRTVQHGVGGGFRIRSFLPNARGEWTESWIIGPTDAGGSRMAGAPRAERFFAWEVTRGRDRRSEVVTVRSARTGAVLDQAPVSLGYGSGFFARPDGLALVTFRHSSLYFWQPGEKVQKVRTGTLKHYRSLAFHPDGRHLLAGNNDTTARLIDTQTWQVVRQYTWDIGRLAAVDISPDGALAAAGGTKGRVVVWDLDI